MSMSAYLPGGAAQRLSRSARAAVYAAGVTFLMSVPAAAQQPEPLAVGRTVERALAVGESHAYTLVLDSGQFVRGRAVQAGIDLQVKIVVPRGDTVARFDSPNGAEGPEPFQFTTTARGEHRIVIAPFETATGAGRYTLVVSQVEPVATTPAGRVQQLMAGLDPAGPGAFAVFVRDGKAVYQEAWGLANLTHRIPFTLETPTNIGSTSKHFTAFAILQLAAQGKLTLEDDVRKHIPELPDLGQTVRIRHLLTHTSGYREFLNALLMAGRRIDEGDHVDRDEVIALVQRQPALQNAPGAEFNYNNTAFALLATIVERAGGMPFPDWMREKVFRPLGMQHTLVRAAPGQVIPGSAQGYVPGPGGWLEARDLGGAMGAGGIYTTAGDLVRWMRNFRTAEVGPPGFFTQMTTRNVLTSGDTSSYGLGLGIGQWRGLRRVEHGGADIAHRSAFKYFPDLDAGVIVQSNGAAFNAEAYADQVAEIFLETELKAAAPAAVVATTAFDPARFDTLRFDAYAGRYAMAENANFILSFLRRGTRYFTQATGQPEIEMVPSSDTTFTIAMVNAEIIFHREPDGRVPRITLNQGGRHTATRVPDEPVPAPDLAQFAGRYFSAELEVYYDVVLEGDSLVLRGRRTRPLTLKHQKDEQFTGGMPIATVAFERDAEGRVVSFRAGNGRTRDVVFRKVE